MTISRLAGLRLGTPILFMLALLVPQMASAIVIYDDFGVFNDADWGGSGIPNDNVAQAMQIVDGDVTITLAMSATQRYSNPALTNNGAGIYYAGTGSNFGGAGESSTEGALWNFNYFIKVEGAQTDGTAAKLTDYQFDLFYDFDPASNTPIGSLGKINLTNGVLATDPTATVAQDSQNLMFGFLATNVPGLIAAPGGTFAPDAIGNYQFAIQVNDVGGFGLETVAIEVETVPVPAAVWLFGSGLLGLAGFARGRKKV